MTMDEKVESDTDWAVECSDDEKYDPVGKKKGVWEPDPKDIKALYERLSNGETLTLEWKCRGRRSPTAEHKEQDMDHTTGTLKEEKPKIEDKSIPTEFDFQDDFDMEPVNPVTPRRTPGSSKTPRTQTKRVARLDNILEDIRRHKKINEEAVKTPSSSQTSSKARSSPSVSVTTPHRPLQKGNMSPKKIS